MAVSTVRYLLNNTDDSRRIVLQPGAVDGFGSGAVQRSTDLTLYGNGALNWGERFNENFLRLMENFAVAEVGGSNASPAPAATSIGPKNSAELGLGLGVNLPMEGQFWYNKSRGVMFVYTGVVGDGVGGYTSATPRWMPASNVLVVDDFGQRDSLLANPRPGDLVFNKDVDALEVFNGTDWTAGFVKLSGDTMTGFLTLHALPTDPFHAATKGYVDAALGGGIITDHGALTGLGDNDHPQYLLLTGGTMSGILSLGNYRITNLASPSAGTDAANRTYVDSQVALKVSKSGDTMTGALNMSGQRINNITQLPITDGEAASKWYVDQAVGSGAFVPEGVHTAAYASTSTSYAGRLGGLTPGAMYLVCWYGFCENRGQDGTTYPGPSMYAIIESGGSEVRGSIIYQVANTQSANWVDGALVMQHTACIQAPATGKIWCYIDGLSRPAIRISAIKVNVNTIPETNPPVMFLPPGGGGGGGSIYVGAYAPFYEDRTISEMSAGDRMLLLSPDRTGTVEGKVISTRMSQQMLVTLVSKSGIELTVSDNTPLTLEDGSVINSTQALGHKLPVQDENGFRWEKITAVYTVGMGDVITIFCDNQCYAAGNVPGRWIWTHNEYVVKV